MKPSIKFILIKEDLSHIFEINNALSQNELICFTGDRYFEGNKTMQAELLGKEADFPAGPWLRPTSERTAHDSRFRRP